jgi:hypothetical protein
VPQGFINCIKRNICCNDWHCDANLMILESVKLVIKFKPISLNFKHLSDILIILESVKFVHPIKLIISISLQYFDIISIAVSVIFIKWAIPNSINFILFFNEIIPLSVISEHFIINNTLRL